MSRIEISRIFTFSWKASIVGVLMVLGAEAALRIVPTPALDYYRSIKLLHVYHPAYWVGLKPGADIFVRHFNGLWQARFTTNSYGYRGSPEPIENRATIACLGDSIVMGFGVSDNQTFCHGLQNIRLGGKIYQSMNLGVDAFGSMGSALRLAEAARRLPHLKIALFVVSPNDYMMAPELRARGERADDEKEFDREKNPMTRKIFRLQFEATRLSYFLHALKLSYLQIRARIVATRSSILREMIEMGLLDVHQISGAEYGSGDSYNSPCIKLPRSSRPLCYLRKSFYSPPDKKTCAISEIKNQCPEPAPSSCRRTETSERDLPSLPPTTIRAYEFLLQTARKNGIHLLPVLLPIQEETIRCEQNGLYSSGFDYALRARRYFRSKKIRVIDLRPQTKRMCNEKLGRKIAGRERSRLQDYFIPGDGHFTSMGNRWVAESLRTELKRIYSR